MGHSHIAPRLITITIALTLATAAHAQQPDGWVGNGHISAYTLKPGEFELSGSLMRVNDTIDFLDLREELLAGSTRLSADSGDLKGFRGELRAGVWEGLELFYQRLQQDMTLKLGSDARVDVSDLAEKLQTTGYSYGARWTVYESQTKDSSRPWTSAALELSSTRHKSNDFTGMISTIRFSPTVTVQIDPPQQFAMDRLSDEAWNAKLIYTHGLSDTLTLSYWAGYGQNESSSGTNSSFEQRAIKEAFLQTFDVEETVTSLGANINWQLRPRLPIQAGYEYLNISSREQTIVSTNSTLVPSFLRGTNVGSSARANHALYGKASWWFTPRLYSSLSGKVFRNQFVGILPHYNNPLSARFSETMYGYVELNIGFKL